VNKNNKTGLFEESSKLSQSADRLFSGKTKGFTELHGTLGVYLVFSKIFNVRRIFMNLALKKSILKWAIVTLALILIMGCSRNSSPTGGNQHQKNTTTSGQQNATSNNSTPSSSTSSDASKSIVYKNTKYGFSFKLPASWRGYSIITSQWEGIANENGSTVDETGPIISIRNPKWTKETPRQDIPIMVFTFNQWNSLKQGVFHIGAAPVDPTELGRNNYYMFALPARYNYAFLPGYEDVEKILAGNPLQTTQLK